MNKEYPWTKEQIDTLTSLYPTCFACDIAEQMGISYNVVCRKARQLGLKKADGFNIHANYGKYAKKGNHFGV